MEDSSLIDSAPEVVVKHSDDSYLEADYSGWTTGLPEASSEIPSPLLTAVRVAVVLAVIGLVYLAVQYLSIS